MKLFMNSVKQTEESLAAIALRLQSRPETSALSKEIINARETLLLIDGSVESLQKRCEASLEALLQSETQLNTTLSNLEKELRQHASANYLLKLLPAPSPKVQERISKVRHLLFALDNASFSWGLGPLAVKLRQAVFAIEDNIKRRELLLRARSNALQERVQALDRSKQLLHRLVLQSKLLFPVVPVFVEVDDRFLPRAA
jgi:phosphoglycerate-specific signal transduction histidine kinase